MILQSELPSLIPRHPDEPGKEYDKRFCDAQNDMIRRGVYILNDQCTADVVPDQFFVRGRDFDVGPKSGITKREYREFNEWFRTLEDEVAIKEVPEGWREYEVQNGE